MRGVDRQRHRLGEQEIFDLEGSEEEEETETEIGEQKSRKQEHKKWLWRCREEGLRILLMNLKTFTLWDAAFGSNLLVWLVTSKYKQLVLNFIFASHNHGAE